MRKGGKAVCSTIICGFPPKFYEKKANCKAPVGGVLTALLVITGLPLAGGVQKAYAMPLGMTFAAKISASSPETLELYIADEFSDGYILENESFLHSGSRASDKHTCTLSYSSESDVPWYSKKDSIKIVSIDTTPFDSRIGPCYYYLGDNVFAALTNCTTITIGSNVLVASSHSNLMPTPTTTASGKASNGKWGLGSENASVQYTADELPEHLTEGTWYAQAAADWTDSTGSMHDVGTYVARIPKAISYSSASAGNVSTTDPYSVTIEGNLSYGKGVKLSADTRASVSGDNLLGNVVETTSIGDENTRGSIGAYSDTNYRIFTNDQISATTGDLTTGLTVSDNISLTGVARSAGKYSGTIQYKADLITLATVTSVDIPAFSAETYTYDGTEHSATISGVNTDAVTVTGTTSAINAGTYTVKASLNDLNAYQWSDGTTAPKSFTWTIAKAPGTLTVSPESVTCSAGKTLVQAITASDYKSNGVSWSFNDISSILKMGSLETSGTAATVTLNGTAGSYNIVCTAPATQNYDSVSKTITVSVK